jgi:molybdate transport system substrate-binding protein
MTARSAMSRPICLSVCVIARRCAGWRLSLAGNSMDRFAIVALLLFSMVASTARAADVLVAVAANFMSPMEEIAAGFERETGYKTSLTFGSTGMLYAQIQNGAPYDVFLSADADTVRRLEREGAAVSATRFTYAIGKLVLWSPKAGWVDKDGRILRTSAYSRIAIADPSLAPYGAAAMQAIRALQLADVISPRIVQGENISQTFQFVKSGNAELGFVALSQVMRDGKITEGSAWVVPASLYSAIRQDAIILKKGADNVAAKALMNYLRSEEVRAMITGYGYDR